MRWGAPCRFCWLHPMCVSLPSLFSVCLWRKVRPIYWVRLFLTNLYQMYNMLPAGSALMTPLGIVLTDSGARLTLRLAHHQHSLSLALSNEGMLLLSSSLKTASSGRLERNRNNCLRGSDWMLCAIKLFQNCCLSFPIPLIITSFFLGTNMFF